MNEKEFQNSESEKGRWDKELKCDNCGGNAWLALPENGVAGTEYTGLDEEELRHSCGAIICETCSLENGNKCPKCELKYDNE